MIDRKTPFYIVDVFAESKYAGNQLAVFTDAKNISSEEMAEIACETNFSETTFITGYNSTNAEVDVRIFTPGGEVPFAGHPTLGTAYIANKVFFEDKFEEVKLNLKVGQIPVKKVGEQLWMNQVQPIFGDIYDIEEMADMLGINSEDIDNRYPIESVSTGLPFYITPVKSLEILQKIKLNFDKAIAGFSKKETKEVLVFSPTGYSNSDRLACRVFVPLLGIPEDPATGSANGCLAAYLVKHIVLGDSEINLSVAQGYEVNRPSRLYLKASVNDNNYTIRVGGKVIDIAQGSWC